GASGVGAAVSLKVVPRPDEASETPVSDTALLKSWSVPEGHCPKCIAVRPGGATSCAQCGLVFAAFQPEAREPSPAIAELWKAVLSRWSDLERHDRLLQGALAHGELAMLGRLYRIRLAHSPNDPYARRGRDEGLRVPAARPARPFRPKTN